MSAQSCTLRGAHPTRASSTLHTHSSSSPVFSFLWKPFWLPCVCIYFLSGSVHDSSTAGWRSQGRAGLPRSCFPYSPALFWAAFWKAVPWRGAVLQAAGINLLCLCQLGWVFLCRAGMQGLSYPSHTRDRDAFPSGKWWRQLSFTQGLNLAILYRLPTKHTTTGLILLGFSSIQT